jgi:hypothetical protein
MSEQRSPDPPLKLAAGTVEWRTYGNEVVLLDLRTSTYLSTNPAASVLWRLLADGTSRASLVDALVETYAVPREQAVADVDAFLAECRRRDLLEPTAAT